MTRHEWNEILNWMTLRWGEVTKWSLDKQQAYFEDLEAYPASAVRAVVERKYENGEPRAPIGGQILASLRESGATMERRAPHDHVWGILEYEDDRPDGLRLSTCVVCHEDRLDAPESFRTVGGA
jgi:hypothetical protein